MKILRVRLLILLCFILLAAASYARHITGGEVYYVYSGSSNGLNNYHVTVKLFRDCYASSPLDQTAVIGVFDNGTNSLYRKYSVPISSRQNLFVSAPNECISNPPDVCYEVGYYQFDISVPSNSAGYTISYQRCCRIAGINNLVSSSDVGATYTAMIPGNSGIATAPENNSARFQSEDTAIVCGGYPFTIRFSATDDDGDVLEYFFCGAYPGGSTNSPAPDPPTPPPYYNLNYSFPYSATFPMGSGVTVDRNTGIVSGICPTQGIYVLTVCVNEIRNGVVIATQRKDLQIKAGDCQLIKPVVDPEYITCDGFTMNFALKTTNPLIKTYDWTFGDPVSGSADSSKTATPQHIYSDTGIFNLKIIANKGQACSDSSIAVVKVYPGFFPDFSWAGICFTNPTLFSDGTTTRYGSVDKWTWNYGDGTTAGTVKNPTHQYTTTGIKSVSLIVGSSKGCLDTITKTINLIDKPSINLPFKDTLICSVDSLQLQAIGNGIFSWGPLLAIQNASTSTPTVRPQSNTTYVVTLNDQGCINKDSILVRVVHNVSFISMPDAYICLTDPVQLAIQSNALKFQWTPPGTLNNATTKNPIATPTGNTIYRVTASIGSCTVTDSVRVFTFPYPMANAGTDTTICYHAAAYLHGIQNGEFYSWAPVTNMNNNQSLNPIVKPLTTTAYILSTWNASGCQKKVTDTVLVNVLPRILAYAGRDTTVVAGQPLQLQATGGSAYMWVPATGLNNAIIDNPIATYSLANDSVKYMVLVSNNAGCVDTAYLKVVVFKTAPSIFVPTAFTPNSDGINDMVKVYAVGTQRLVYFNIYNRWGQRLFSTSINGDGWNGRVDGQLQQSNVYVWEAQAIDYTGKPLFAKGTITLIR